MFHLTSLGGHLIRHECSGLVRQGAPVLTFHLAFDTGSA